MAISLYKPLEEGSENSGPQWLCDTALLSKAVLDATTFTHMCVVHGCFPALIAVAPEFLQRQHGHVLFVSFLLLSQNTQQKQLKGARIRFGSQFESTKFMTWARPHQEL